MIKGCSEMIKGCSKMDDEDNENKKKRLKEMDDNECLPDELLIESILTRLPARTLVRFSCVRKSWYDSILNDKRFAKVHFFQNQDKLNLVFDILNVWKDQSEKDCFLNLEMDPENENWYKHRLLMELSSPCTTELVGYCNGLPCTYLDSKSDNVHVPQVITVVNPMRRQSLSLSYFNPTEGCQHLCHGFGFDSLTGEYKVVIISTSKDNEEFICMVFTLGTNLWRKMVTRVVDMSPPPGCFSFPKKMVTRASKISRRSATFYGGDLFWRITSRVEEDAVTSGNLNEIRNFNKIDMLLSFDIHKEKIQFIPLPSECSLDLTMATMNVSRYLVVDHHLLEHKGYLCVAYSEHRMQNNEDQDQDHHHHQRHHCNDQSNSCCCCRFVVQFYMLKDKVKQVWIKGETLSLQIKELDFLPAPLCCYFDTTTATATTPPTRIMSFSDQALLYWFNGKSIILYNLHKEHLTALKPSSSYSERSRLIFEAKAKGSLKGRCNIGDDNNFHCPYMDYQLHAQVENICSLKTFIPDGKASKFQCYDDFIQFFTVENKVPAGWVTTPRENVKFHAF